MDDVVYETNDPIYGIASGDVWPITAVTCLTRVR